MSMFSTVALAAFSFCAVRHSTANQVMSCRQHFEVHVDVFNSGFGLAAALVNLHSTAQHEYITAQHMTRHHTMARLMAAC
jgi:hypothetical protein